VNHVKKHKADLDAFKNLNVTAHVKKNQVKITYMNVIGMILQFVFNSLMVLEIDQNVLIIVPITNMPNATLLKINVMFVHQPQIQIVSSH